MKKIKIAYVINDLLLGGAQKLVYDLSRKLDSQKYEVTVYYLYDYENTKVTLKDDFLKNGFMDGINLLCLQSICGSKSFVKMIQICTEIFRHNKQDLVHIFLPDALIVSGTASIFTKTPFIIHELNTHSFHSWKIKIVFLLLRKFSSLTICYAETVEKEIFHSSTVMRDNKDFKWQKVITILNGIDASGLIKCRKDFTRGECRWIDKRKNIGITDDEIIIFSAARFVKWKGHHLLIEAFVNLLKKKYLGKVVLVIAGEGPEKEQCIQLVKNYGIESKVRFLGGRTDINELLVISDIFSLVFDYDKNINDAEAIGISGFEAMAAGLPTLIGDYGGADFYVKNWKNGIIVKKNNVEDLSNCLEELIKNDELRERIGEDASVCILNLLDWSKIIQIYDSVYIKILCKHDKLKKD